VSFDGSNDAVRVADSNSLDLTNAMSVEAWIKPNLLPAAGTLATVVAKAESYALRFNGSRLEFTVIQNGSRRRLQAPAGAIVAGQTYHVVGTYDGATRRLYVNGVQVASGALTGPATATPSTLNIGAWSASREFFNGTIDEVAVYNRTLTASRVSAHYAAGRGTAASQATAPTSTTQTTTASRAPAGATDARAAARPTKAGRRKYRTKKFRAGKRRVRSHVRRKCKRRHGKKHRHRASKCRRRHR
jgi:hypothetical protein